ncbi:hypothetical protein CEE45_02025 [Candidatus Heimdallarchaeota archaeon B3_Heim]|nr:MAG: hypothetical protein CEE45_02025 [Candidatus Heimdallarchaeota archaeon B3_Heim]
MKLTLGQITSIIFPSILLIEFLAITILAVLSTSDSFISLYGAIFVLAIPFGIILAFVQISNVKKGEIQNDERIERYIERSVMIGGIAGIFLLLQLALIEIVIGITFSTLNTFIYVYLVFSTALYIAYIIQTKTR